MSAWQCSETHVGALVKWARLHVPATEFQILGIAPDIRFDTTAASAVFRTLAEENVKSLVYRYSNETWDAVEQTRDNVADYPEISDAEAYQLASCYRYQSCEHPGWESSAACRLITRIEHWAVWRNLPRAFRDAVNDAPWGIDDDFGPELEIAR